MSQDDRTLQQPVEPRTEDKQGLVKYEESSNVVETSVPGVTYLKFISSPFPDETPRDVLSRAYLIDQFNWVPAMAMKVYKFPHLLFNIPTIAHYLKPFAYFRAGVHIQIKMNSTPYHQGALVMGALPCADLTGFIMEYVCGLRSIVMSASVQDSGAMTIPYIHPNGWVPITGYDQYQICSVGIAVLNGLISSSPGIDASVPISVYANFVNPEVAGFNQPVAKAQSGKPTKKGAIFNLAEMDYEPSKEAEEKQSKGMDSKAVSKVIGGVSEVIKVIPIIGDIYRPIANFVSTYLRHLDKPTAVPAIQYIDSTPTRYHPFVSGLFNGDTMSMYPNPMVHQTDFGMETSDITVSALAQIP